MQDYNYPGRKRILPKRPVVQINIGMREPQPYGYHIPHMIPHGPKHLFVPGRGNIYNNRMRYNPVGEIIDFVADPIGFMVEKSLGLRSNKPKTEKKKEGETKKEEGKEKSNEIINEEQKEVVLRARKKETEEQEEPEYEEVEYKEDQDQEQIQQQEAICPECAQENLCPECQNENICPECQNENVCQECKDENICPECDNKLKKKTNKISKFNNFNFHEIVATSDNKKSYVVVKKGGVTISEN